MRRDLLSAYAASGARVLSWLIVSAVVFRAHPFQFAMLALIRGTLTLLNYTTLGLAPAMIRLLAEARAVPRHVLPLEEPQPHGVLGYEAHAATDPRDHGEMRSVYASGVCVAVVAGIVGLGIVWAYAANFDRLHEVPVQVTHLGPVVVMFGLGIILRLMSEAPGAVVQTTGFVARDNRCVFVAEAAWVGLMLVSSFSEVGDRAIDVAAWTFAVSGALMLLLRAVEASRHVTLRWQDVARVQSAALRRLAAVGGLIGLGQLADFLYAPTDYILINRYVTPGTVAVYAPAVQIDAGLLLLVGALAAVLLPKAATAHVAGEVRRLRQYYVRGTLSAAGLLLAASLVVYAVSPWVFRLWLGDTLPRTRAILPLVLAHTVLGGSSGVGRSILLAMGKAKPFAVAMLVAGGANVICSYVFVAHMGLGLRGVIYGTIAVAVGRCVIWQPWYVLRTLRRETQSGARHEIQPEAAAVAPEPL
jgi:O-antigen/teichoic acid export membrane protein